MRRNILFYLYAVSPKIIPLDQSNLIQGRIMYQQETLDGRSLLPFVKGIAMETRKIGTSDVFNSRFTSSILATAGANKNGPFRLPCENCDCLIPIFEMVPGATAYNSDLLTLQQKGSS